MLGKLIKHDLNYSKKTFFALAAVMLAFSLVAVLSALFDFNFNHFDHFLEIIFTIVITSAMVIGFILLYNAYKKSLFGQNGYLFLTLPVSKGKLLLSKVIGALIWFNFMWVITLVTAVAMSMAFVGLENFSISFDGFGMNVLGAIGDLVMAIIFINVMVFTGLMGLFMTITLANSSFRTKRVHWTLAGIIGIGYYLVWGFGLAFVMDIIVLNSVGRVLEMLFIMLGSLGVGMISYLITLQLIKKKVELD